MTNRKTRLLSLLLASVMTLALLSGCSKDTGSSSGNGGEGKDSLVVATMSETPSWAPMTTTPWPGTI